MSNYPAISEPTLELHSLLRTVREIKELVEALTGQRGSAAADIVSRVGAAEQAIDFVLGTTDEQLATEVRNARGGQVDLATRITQVSASVPAAFAARSVTAGTGVTGGGNLSADRAFALDLTYTDGRYVQVGLAYGAVGTYLWSTTGASTAGSTVVGSSLTPSQSGNWRQMSNSISGGGLFYRVS